MQEDDPHPHRYCQYEREQKEIEGGWGLGVGSWGLRVRRHESGRVFSVLYTALASELRSEYRPLARRRSKPRPELSRRSPPGPTGVETWDSPQLPTPNP